MSALLEPRFWLVVAGTALATLLFVRVARRLSWGDAPAGAAGARKLQRGAVPPVGGAALLVGLALAGAERVRSGTQLLAPGVDPGVVRGALASLVLVFAVGLADDLLRDGLRPLAKLSLQGLALLPFALALALAGGAVGGAGGAVAVLLLALVALNVLNTYDNADGAVGLAAAAAFLLAGPWVLAALLGFLPFNLDAARRGRRAQRAPTAYLGDAGAFVLAFLIVLHPTSWGVLWVPFLDLLRLSIVRIRVGSRPWIGDRRHLAHLLQRRGLAPPAVALLLAGLALPVIAGVALEPRAAGAALSGCLLSTFLFGACLRWVTGEEGGPSPGETA
jgi:UDP-GlcNAc:undecaprenyl-phosphate GlcNAc-1-phosphate transferase